MANPLLIMPFLEFGAKLLERWFPDPEKKAAAEMELFKLAQAGELQTVIAQLQVNAKEAEHQSVFVAGWRPFVGWVCGFSFLYTAVLHSMLAWYARAKGWPAPPTLDSDILIYVLGGMLGLGGYRTMEKVKGVTK
jgi:hypothetical protein